MLETMREQEPSRVRTAKRDPEGLSFTRWHSAAIVGLWLVALISVPAMKAEGCPFCSAVSQTIDEEMQSMDVAILARLEYAADMEAENEADEGELPQSRFRAVEILKGDNWVKVDHEIKATYFGPAEEGALYLMMAADPPNLMWGNAMLLSPRGAEYVRKLPELPRDSSRLKFFLKYMEDKDELLARDCYDEFAKAPYTDIIALKSELDRKQLLAWIRDRNVSVERRRLYLTMLGICGEPEDADALAKLIQSPDEDDRAGLNALIAAYLSLAGEAGLPLINDLFLANKDTDYGAVHAAIMALRFHGTEAEVIPRPPLLRSMHLILEREDIADLVIPDLARWEDWSALDRLVELFQNANPKANWVRVPVVNYVRVCPLPEAKAAMDRLKEIDAEAVKRASSLFPFTASDMGVAATSSQAEPDKETETRDSDSGEDASLVTKSTGRPPDPFANLGGRFLDADADPVTPSNAHPLSRPGSLSPWLFIACGATFALIGMVLFATILVTVWRAGPRIHSV